MTKELSPAVSAELVKSASRPLTLYELTLTGADPLYLAEYDEDIAFDGKLYNKFPISHDVIRSSADETIDSVRIAVANVDRQLSRLLVRNNGFRGGRVRIMTVFSDLLDDPANALIKFDGWVSTASVSQDSVAFEVTGKLDLQDLRLPRRTYRKDICQWFYKDPLTCQYAGPLLTCDKTLDSQNGCRAHANIAHFGSFPAIPEARSLIL